MAVACSHALFSQQTNKFNPDQIAFISAVGSDLLADSFFLEHDKLFNTQGVVKLPGATGVYLAISKGSSFSNDLLVGIAQVDIMKQISPQIISKALESHSKAKIVVLDGNLTEESLSFISEFCLGKNIQVWYEPTSVAKAVKILQVPNYKAITYISPNRGELEEMVAWLTRESPEPADCFTKTTNLQFDPIQENDPHQAIKRDMICVLNAGIQNVLTTLGYDGVLLGGVKENSSKVEFYHFPAFPTEVQQVNGAGDSLAGCVVAGLISQKSLHESIQLGLKCASCVVASKHLPECI
jgi:sugar/nucleoside kinase (ribokinase family)